MPDKKKPDVPGLYAAFAATTTEDRLSNTIEHHLFIANTDEEAAAEGRRRCRGARLVSIRREADADVI